MGSLNLSCPNFVVLIVLIFVVLIFLIIGEGVHPDLKLG